MSAELIDHRARPGPGYWEWRCLQCSEPVSDHMGPWQLFLRRLKGVRES